MIPFNKPYLTGKEGHYIYQAVFSGKISGDGMFTKKCHQLLERKYGFSKVLLTTSCTDALEMAAILIDIKPGDEIIAPSYTFVSTVNAFALRGAKIVFADSYDDNPNMDVSKLEALITPKTKAIIPVHYAGVACDMDTIMDLAKKFNLYVIEDAAQAIDSYYTDRNGKKRPLGSIGHMSSFSFHETKNIISGEGGMLAINDERFVTRAEVIREKGTNRSAFFRGEVDKYGWVDIGSSYLPSDIIAAFLYAQLENIEDIQVRRKEIWNRYYEGLSSFSNGNFTLPKLPVYATNNAHMFFIVCNSLEDRSKLIAELKNSNILAVFHYQSLHRSSYYLENNIKVDLPNSDTFTDRLVRLPLFYELTNDDIDLIISIVNKYYV